MQTTENFVDPGAGLVLTPEAQTYLRESGKWANFLGIIGFVMCGLFLILSLFVGTLMTMMAQISPIYAAMPAAVGGVVTAVFILFDILYFFFALYLYQFGSKIKKGLSFGDSEQVTTALGKLKSFFKLWGIVTIVILCLYALEIVVGIIIGIAVSHR
ncbi:DUF5362 family protein [Mucilaginibacter flavidus]|uniref:DUF5362 family protein n=1 Tax=Mucilaginibacter flavidus TaxID=2949309 RepID=UPI002092D796|nr:DUF5362 family protein [Mucilaginibacter flavidus]MCO5948690.1 DUF5362 domain-containing protein [Mucilaginibacter flavidus]